MTLLSCRPPRGTKTLRWGRYSGVNQIYHVITCTAAREPLFQELALGRKVVRAMKREDDAGHSLTLAFVVMPDHLHWLFQLIGERSLSTAVNTMKSHSARRVNQAVGHTGKVWQKGFYDRALRREESLKNTARYIVANPLRAGIVDSVWRYPLWDAKWM